ncbi:relaxase/mobilization nuclease domain-containing protein [Streptococcus pneumoniae]|uniref:relaxase/mobilization nuclease domain-containing protein n=1 Tax=Streptococcus pneumoniae TaxID=1313 RepID=UPI0005DB9352|nr:relaxase [Streptococcus pneumoniae]
MVKDGRVVKQLVSTYGITDASTATEEFLLTKKNAAQRAGTKELSDIQNPNRVLAHHIIQSFSPEDDLTPQEIHEIGRKTILELTGGQHEFVIATHMDKGHIHNHIIFNSTNSVFCQKKFFCRCASICNSISRYKLLDYSAIFDHCWKFQLFILF